MELAVEQHQLESKTFKVKMNQVLNENERLLEQVISKDIVNIIVNSSVDTASVNVHESQSQVKDTIIKKLKERIKSLSGNIKEDKIKKDLEEIETINIKLDHRVSNLIAENEHLKQTYKQLYDLIKSSRIRSKEQCDDLIDQVNLKSMEISDLIASLQEKVLVITALKDDLRKPKGKALADDVVTSHSIALEILKVDVEPLAPKFLNNRTVYSDYLRHTQELAAILKEVVEQGKSQNPLNNSLDHAYFFQLLFDELLTPPPSVDHPAPEVITLIGEVVASEPAASTGLPSSTTVDQDVTLPSNSQTTPKTQSLIIPNVAEEDNHDIDVVHMNNDPFFGIPIPKVPSYQSSSMDFIHTIVHPDHQISKHNSKWTKDHPLENIIGEVARLFFTRLQLHEQALFCYYDAFLTVAEPKTYKDAFTQSCWIKAIGLRVQAEESSLWVETSSTRMTGPATGQGTSNDTDFHLEVHTHNNHFFENVNHHVTQGMHREEQLDSDVDSNIDDYDKIIPYHQYQSNSEVKNVPTKVSPVLPDQTSMITILDDMRLKLEGYMNTNKEQSLTNDSLKAELERYKTQVQNLEQCNVKRDLEQRVIKRNKQNADLEEKIVSLKQQLSQQVESNKSLKTKSKKLKTDNKACIEDNLCKEVSEYMKIFNELDKEYDQCMIDKKCLEIENKNLLIQNECLLAESVFKDICSLVLTSDNVVPISVEPCSNYDKEQTKNLELEAEISKVLQLLIDKERRCSHIETEYLNLELKFQKYKECFENPQVCNNLNSPELNIFFEINKLKEQLQGKDNIIRKLKAHINNMKDVSTGPSLSTLEIENTQLKEELTAVGLRMIVLEMKMCQLKHVFKNCIRIKSVPDASKSKSKSDKKIHKNLPARSDMCPLTRITKPEVVSLENSESVRTSEPTNNVTVTPRFSEKTLTSYKRKDRNTKDTCTGSPSNIEIMPGDTRIEESADSF
nr:hypothetical protein [Tanacetum cinerariifolium]